jgi:hypothetical protein
MSRLAKGLIVAIVLVLMAGAGVAWTVHESGESRGVAVVELFTSEGCSSCPPADALLAKMVRERRQHVYPLAFHVDYWDTDQWRDKFSDARYSDRQQAYAKAAGARGAYTPQMLVNGEPGFVGSDEETAARQIANALKRPATYKINLRIDVTSEGVVAQCDFDPSAAGKMLNLALVERGIEREIKRGENAGRVLRHENVVREFQTFRIAGSSAKSTLPLPPDAVLKNCSIIAYIQDGQMHVLGASAVDLAGTTPAH